MKKEEKIVSYKHLVVGGIFLTSALFMSGCSVEGTVSNTEEHVADKVASISVPFDWFRKDPGTKKVTIPTVHGLDLSKEKVDVDGLVNVQKNIAEISKLLTNKENFKEIVSGDRTIFNLLGSEYMSMNYNDRGDAFTTAIQEIGKTPHQWINSLTLREYGVRTNAKGKPEHYAVVDVNAVNDTEKFHIQSLRFTLDQNGLIQTSAQIGTPVDKTHTVTPLTKDSLLYDDTHQEFQHDMEKVIRSLSNPTIYAQIKSGEITSTDSVIKSLTKQVGVEYKNASTIVSLVKDGEGSFSEWGITGYLFDDKDVSGKTYYELTIANEDGYHYYTVQYNRGTKEITDISIGSPFKEVN